MTGPISKQPVEAFISSRRRHTRPYGDWSSDVCSSDLTQRRDQGETGRFRFYSRDQIAARSDNLDIAWLKDTSDDPEDTMTDPEDLVAAIAGHLRAGRSEERRVGKEGSSRGRRRRQTAT